MHEILLFTKPDCEKCQWVKERIPEGLDVKILDMNQGDAMAEAAYYELIGKNIPIMVLDGEVEEVAAKMVRKLEELAAE